ncbi:MAG: DUF2934 domain-containing protein [Telmatospirillum sp.]|nr:DUF2934 domain-containing protein [Telmatospirillum sp.]
MIDENRIRQRAFEIWQAQGCPEGRDLDHWLQAEVELQIADSRRSRGDYATVFGHPTGDLTMARRDGDRYRLGEVEDY